MKVEKLLRKQLEKDLENFPVWLIKYDIEESQTWEELNKTIKNTAIDNIEIKKKMEKITKVLSFQDQETQKIINEYYFKNLKSREEIIKELNISKNYFYRVKNKALIKLALALGHMEE